MGYTIRSKIESRAHALRIGRMAERWCRSNMGTNRRKKYEPTITYYKSMEGDLDMGEYRYWDNEIIIYYNNCGNVKNLIRTIIHEWQHQLQPMTKYEALDAKYGYRKNPLEIEAEAAEEKYYKELWMSIKPKINRI
jgi:Zn-dependent peptidase ImmA (M78 family)